MRLLFATNSDVMAGPVISKINLPPVLPEISPARAVGVRRLDPVIVMPIFYE